MKFFTRTKLLANILTVFDIIAAVCAVFSFFKLDRLNITGWTIFFTACIIIFLLLTVIVIALKAVSKDAAEDLKAILDYSDKK